MALPLLTISAVPFVYGENSIAARRQLRRSSASCQTTATANSGLLSNLEHIDPEKKSVIMGILSEAAREIQTVMGLASPAQRHPESQLVQPPNSPNENAVFHFPQLEVNESDGLVSIGRTSVNSVEDTTSSEDDNEASPNQRPKRSRSFRKRRRIPSFKTGTPPRVPSKISCSDAGEADDEDSEPEPRVALVPLSTEDDEATELRLKLNLLSETRQSQYSDKNEWAKVGTELRIIADSFSMSLDGDDVDGNSSSQMDILSIINMMLPVSVPHSLWSALVSYAAWKIFKRFQ
jgi:hypothetical protein